MQNAFFKRWLGWWSNFLLRWTLAWCPVFILFSLWHLGCFKYCSNVTIWKINWLEQKRYYWSLCRFPFLPNLFEMLFISHLNSADWWISSCSYNHYILILSALHSKMHFFSIHHNEIMRTWTLWRFSLPLGSNNLNGKQHFLWLLLWSIWKNKIK